MRTRLTVAVLCASNGAEPLAGSIRNVSFTRMLSSLIVIPVSATFVRVPTPSEPLWTRLIACSSFFFLLPNTSPLWLPPDRCCRPYPMRSAPVGGRDVRPIGLAAQRGRRRQRRALRGRARHDREHEPRAVRPAERDRVRRGALVDAREVPAGPVAAGRL